MKQFGKTLTALALSAALSLSFCVSASAYSPAQNANGRQQSIQTTAENNQTPPERPEGEEGQQPPERPEGENGQQPPERPEGEEGQQPPERPEGEEGQQLSERPEGENGQQPPERPEGEEGQQLPDATNTDLNGRTPPQKPADEQGAAATDTDLSEKPADPKLKSIKSKKGKKMTVKWKKSADAEGYELQYSRDKKFRKGTKTVEVDEGSTTEATVKNLKKGKYYVRVRAVSEEGNSDWSAVKSATIKK